MSSYLTYRITTKTTLSIFKQSEFSVNRRFSDFLGLHNNQTNYILVKKEKYGMIQGKEKYSAYLSLQNRFQKMEKKE